MQLFNLVFSEEIIVAIIVIIILVIISLILFYTNHAVGGISLLAISGLIGFGVYKFTS